VNYKTGVKDILIRMVVENGRAAIGIEIRNSDKELQADRFAKLHKLKNVLRDYTGEDWEWKNGILDDNGREISYAGIYLDGVSIMNKEDWSVIISFLKPRLIALDNFWITVKDQF
jgi:hypothetical protein